MPIAPTPTADDSQAGSAWLLFGAAAKALRDGRDAADRDRLLNNAYRGLQGYSAELEDPIGASGIHGTTRDAISVAFERTAPGVPRAQALSDLFGRMRAVVTGEGEGDDDVDHLARFFECARERLDRPAAGPGRQARASGGAEA